MYIAIYITTHIINYLTILKLSTVVPIYNMSIILIIIVNIVIFFTIIIIIII